MTLILRSDKTITSPISGTPQVGNISSGLWVDWDADSLTGVANGAEIPRWDSVPAGSSAAFNTITSGGSWPTKVDAAANGHSAVAFSSAGKDSINAPTPGYSKPSTLVAVFKATALADQRLFSIFDAGGDFVGLQLTALGGMNMAYASGKSATTPNIANAYKAGIWTVAHLMFSPTEVKISLNGSSPVSAGVPGISTSGPFNALRLGSTGPLTALFDGQVAKLQIFNRLLSDAEVDVHSGYLAARYGV